MHEFVKKNFTPPFVLALILLISGFVAGWSTLNYRMTNNEIKQCAFEEKTNKGFEKLSDAVMTVLTKVSNIEGKLSK